MYVKYNEYQRFGKAFVKLIKKISNEHKSWQLEELTNLLTCFHFRDNRKLAIRYPHNSGMGDQSSFFTYQSEEELCKHLGEYIFIHRHDELHEFEFINVDATPMGAWQALLFHLAPTILPTFWHGGYIKRHWVFSKTELKNISPIHSTPNFSYQIDDKGHVINPLLRFDILPTVTFKDNVATIEFYSWNDWKGLSHETFKVYFADNTIKLIELSNEEVLYEFDCCILF